MPQRHRPKPGELDANTIKVEFSPGVKNALADLDAAVHFSEHFDGDAQAILNDWVKGETPSLHDLLTCLPILASETARHIRFTNDKRAEDAWDNFSSQMNENGFALIQRTLQR